MQKFIKGDKVRIADNLGDSMSHFQKGVDAIVVGSYKDKYGGSNTKSYTVHIRGRGEVSWYYEHQLNLIEKECLEELNEWEEFLDKKEELESDLEYIFEQGDKLLKSAPGASVQKLYSCLGGGSLWGSNGEGINYYLNGMQTLGIAKPFLENHDLEGWLKFCEKFKDLK